MSPPTSTNSLAALAFSLDPGCLRKGWGIMGFLKNNPRQSSRAYPILSDVSGFPGSKIGDTFDSCNIGHGPLKRADRAGCTLWLWIGAPFGFGQGWAGLTSLARI